MVPMNKKNLYNFIPLFILMFFVSCSENDSKEKKTLSSQQLHMEVAPDQGGLGDTSRYGNLLYCHDEEELKSDFLNQLKAHQIYGSPELIDNESIAKTAAYYQKKHQEQFELGHGPQLKKNLFSQLTTEQLFDGAKIFDDDYEGILPQTGDIILNMDFLRSDNPGTFYSKRGMIHARTVLGSVELNRQKYLVLLDGGWQNLSLVKQVNSQSILLRPRAEFFKEQDRQDLIKWAIHFAPVPYDNQLIDNLSEFRNRLHKSIDNQVHSGANPELVRLRSRDRILERSSVENANFAPFGKDKIDDYINPSGFYCSEAGSDIYTYLGFRLYGEVPFEVVTAFSGDGKLPQWSVYVNALSGFGASGTPVEDLHNIFFQYFSLLDFAWKNELLELPEGVDSYDDENFVEAMRANRNAAMSQISHGKDLLLEELNQLATHVAQNAELSGKVTLIREKLLEVTQALSQQSGENLNLTQATNQMFFQNKAYGPNHFLENGDYFDLLGVFYNTDLDSGYQAAWVANSHEGEERVVNRSSTLYEITSRGDQVVDGKCENSGLGHYESSNVRYTEGLITETQAENLLLNP